jgi:uncharacterized repeat protein (TIGR04138 family)
MASKDRPAPEQVLQQIVRELGCYPTDAFHFVQSGLAWTDIKIHGPHPDEGGTAEPSPGGEAGAGASPGKSSGSSKSAGQQSSGPRAAGPRRAGRQLPEESPRHISGQQLCEGLRMYAIEQWGMMAGTVLRRWNLRATIDFGRIVFALVDGGLMHKTERDKLEDFRDVYDFDRAFDGGGYNIGTRP